jgi:hypothetical protein
MSTKEEIFKLVKQYIGEQKALKSWTPGKDWVQYAGPYFNEDEYLTSIETILDGWLVLGKKGITFENEFPKLLLRTIHQINV